MKEGNDRSGNSKGTSTVQEFFASTDSTYPWFVGRASDDTSALKAAFRVCRCVLCGIERCGQSSHGSGGRRESWFPFAAQGYRALCSKNELVFPAAGSAKPEVLHADILAVVVHDAHHSTVTKIEQFLVAFRVVAVVHHSRTPEKIRKMMPPPSDGHAKSLSGSPFVASRLFHEVNNLDANHP